jgi:uncharacterized membrane protein (DUF373 family)
MKTKLNFDTLVAAGENVIYAIIIIFLFLSAGLLVYDEILTFLHFSGEPNSITVIIEIIAKTLLLLMIIEILYTVRISYKEHTLRAEPFLIVGLIASIRRILIISVETAYMQEYFTNFMIEIGVLIVLSFAFVVAVVLLRKNNIK